MNKKKQKSNLISLVIIGLLTLIVLPILLWMANSKTNSPDSLAAEVQNRIICPLDTSPTLVCPNIQNTSSRRWSWNLWRRKKSDCNWQCNPLPSPVPLPSCQPRPQCLRALVPCAIPEPMEGWCPQPSIIPIPSGPSDRPNPTFFPKPSGIVCIDLVCPLNCVREPVFEQCPICNCPETM